MKSGYRFSITLCLMSMFCATSHRILLLTPKRLQYSEGLSRSYYHRKSKFPRLPERKILLQRKKRKELLKFLSVQLKCAILLSARCKRDALPLNTYHLTPICLTSLFFLTQMQLTVPFRLPNWIKLLRLTLSCVKNG